MAHSHYSTCYLGTDGRWNGANSPIGPWQHGCEGGVERGDWRVLLLASLTPGSAHCTGKPRGSGGDSGRTKLPNPRPLRCLPTPNSLEADGNGYIVMAGRGGPLGRRLWC